MDIEKLKTLIEVANDTPASWRSYSGRGMYGDSCFAITGDMGTLWDFCIALALQDESLADELGAPTTDSMGHSTVFYWPDVSISNEDLVALRDEYGED